MQISRRLYSTVVRKRFYKTVNVISSDKGYEICLDNKKIKTPKGTVIKIPSEPLALAVAQEWDCQKENIQMHRMHLTGLTITCIDNPSGHVDRNLVDKITNFINSDTLLFIDDEQPKLGELQRSNWGEIINWAKVIS